jgi:sigma-B regulation protein RsbU (phosphoserine phosphatase)
MDAPVALLYQRALDDFRGGRGEPAALQKRMSELISLLDFTTTLGSSLTREEILDTALLVVLGELGASRGALFVRGADDLYRLRAARGLPEAGESGGPLRAPDLHEVRFRSTEEGSAAFAAYGLELLCPILRAGRTIALLGLGPRLVGEYGREEIGFLRSVAACAATPIENGLIYDELVRLNQRLEAKIFQLQNLFDVSRELTSSLDEEAAASVVLGTLRGHLLVSRGALYAASGGGFCSVHERGPKAAQEAAPLDDTDVRPWLEARTQPLVVAELPAGALRERLQRGRFAWVVPLTSGGGLEGFLAIGERPGRAPLVEEDYEFALTLGRQGLAAIESARLQRVRLQKERQDRELQIAREIQQSLFPKSAPRIPGHGLAATSRACFEIGGDYFDYLGLPDGRIALVVADVSGKGTPASLLMASVHASLQALAGSAPPCALMERLNRFLFANTQANKYVTLFYGELDPASGSFEYVNAGHVPPFLVGPARRERLWTGGPCLGLLEVADYEAGRVVLGPGDALAIVSDGVTEALSTDDREFGDERVFEALAEAAGGSADAMLDGLVRAVDAFTGGTCSDDLTALLLKADPGR